MSYKESTIWISMALMLYIWSNYFFYFNTLYQSKALTVATVNSLLKDVVILTIVLEIIAQIVLAVINHKDAKLEEDERDKTINLYGSRNAYNILSIGVVAAVAHIIFPTLLASSPLATTLPNEYLALHIIIITAVLAEIIRYATALYYYRQGF